VPLDQDEPQGSTALLLGLLAVLSLVLTGFAFVVPSAQALISRRSNPARQGEILGINQSANAVARILGPLFGMIFYFALRPHVLPYLFGTVLLLSVFFLLLRLPKGTTEITTPKEEPYAAQ